MRIWLDDKRPMPEGYDLHVTHAETCIKLLQAGLVTKISLDHDLGSGLNGYDVACIIEGLARVGYLQPIEVLIHTQNPVGRKRIKSAIANAKKAWEDWPAKRDKVNRW